MEKITTSWEYFQDCKLPVIIYGMGDGADKIIQEFFSLGVSISGIIASDGFVRGQTFHGFRVTTLSNAEELFGDFAIALAFASSRPDVVSHIRAVSEKHKLLAPSVPVFGEGVFNRRFAQKHSDEIFKAYRLLADEKSRKIFELIIEFIFTGELEPLFKSETPKKEAYENILKLSANENYYDLGAYRGDTIAEFLNFCGGNYSSITAFEPDAKNFRKLSDFAANMKNTFLHSVGIWSRDGSIFFADKAGRNSSVSLKGRETPVTCIDSFVKNSGIIPSFIKVDIEGAESEMLKGAEETIKRYKPKLNIALYHRTQDIFSLILRVHELNPEYKLHIRHHPYIPHWDTNLYAV